MKTYKYLGVLIGEDLTFSEQVGRVKGRLISAAFILNQSKSFLPVKSHLQAYRSIFESHLNNATIVWSGNENSINKLATVQNKALNLYFCCHIAVILHLDCQLITYLKLIK